MSEQTYQLVPKTINVAFSWADVKNGPIVIGSTQDGVDGYSLLTDMANEEAKQKPSLVMTNGKQRYCSDSNLIMVFFNVDLNNNTVGGREWFFAYPYDYPIHNHLKEVPLVLGDRTYQVTVIDLQRN